ncbi:uncharacterized protein CEXT_348091 [Caerostris extrusa]|uniref:Uncharacterized protein n=1 Tax=Caerostris extrusa TaxID=172846 RepID=A0AAV4Y3F1_CAEEX|nr:uncharacterized protein CEXT_348091 [Caerostris extrusa]
MRGRNWRTNAASETSAVGVKLPKLEPEFEKKSLRDKYDGLLKKTNHDTNIVLKLKDSQKKLAKKTKEYFKTDRELSAIRYVNTDQTSNRRLREMERRNLANHLKKNTSIMAKINKFHNRIQTGIEDEKKRGESNLEKCEKKMKVLRETLESNQAVYQDFQKALADRKAPVDDLKALVTDGLKIYLGLEKKEEEEEIESIDEKPENELETDTPTELSEVGENKTETKVVEKESLRLRLSKRKVRDQSREKERISVDESSSEKRFRGVAKNQNLFLDFKANELSFIEILRIYKQ